MKEVPLRTCVITKEKCEKRDLLRVVRTPEKTVIFDKTGKQNGKGAYIKRDKDVILKAKKSKALDRILEVPVPDSVFDSLMEEVND